MNDLISRSALIADIEESVRFSTRSGVLSAEMRGANKIVSRIKAAPAVDAVPVVRCKDCKTWDDDPDTYGNSSGPKGKCLKTFETTVFDDFCSYGERRNGDATD